MLSKCVECGHLLDDEEYLYKGKEGYSKDMVNKKEKGIVKPAMKDRLTLYYVSLLVAAKMKAIDF